MRPIDADALMNLPFEKMIHTDFGDTAIPIEEIEMAPTVEYPCPKADPKSGDLISRENLREQIDDCKYFNSSFQKMTVAEFLTIVFDLIDNAPTIAPKFKPVCEVAFDKEELKRIVDENLDKILKDLSQYRDGVVNKASDDGCENCKHQAKLPSQDPCYGCSYCYTSKFEPRDGSEPDMMTEDKLCDECEEKCDWYKESIKKGNMPIGCTQQIADESEDKEGEDGES